MPDPEPAPRKLTLGKKSFERVNPPVTPTTPPADAPPSVTAMLQANLARERAAAPELMPDLRERRTRRRRDYVLSAIAGNLLGVACGVIFPATGLTVFLLAYFVMFNLALIWVLFVVMDKY